MLLLFFILFFLEPIFCNSIENTSNFSVIPTYRIAVNDSIFINLNNYFHDDDFSVSFDSDNNFDLSLTGDSLKIKCIQDFHGYSSIDLIVNNYDIDLMLANPISNYNQIETAFLKNSFVLEKEYVILTYESLSMNNLKLNKFWILFNNQIIDSRYYYIFNNTIRVMLPRSLGDGVLRILSIDNNENYIKENYTLIHSGEPLSASLHSESPYFTNIYHLIIDRFNDADSTNSIHKDDYTIDKEYRFHGGDFKGIEQKVNNGYFNNLGVQGILLSPVCLNQDSAYRSMSIPYKKYMPFEGRMPIDSRKIDYRYGTPDDLRKLVNQGHDHGIKFYIEYINLHTDKLHNYYLTNPYWYIENDSLLDNFSIRKLDYSNIDLVEQISSDILFLMREYDMDGFSITHHSNMDELNSKFNKFKSNNGIEFLKIIEPNQLTARPNSKSSKSNSYYDIDLYKAARDHFSGFNPDFVKLNGLIQKSLDKYGPVNLMINTTSTQKDERFITLADYNDFLNSDLTPSAMSYKKLSMFMTMNYSLPGIPLIFYGEEFGHQGDVGVDSKRDMKFHRALNDLEKKLKARVSILNRIRNKYSSLSIGDFLVLREGADYSVWLKSYFDEQTLILFNTSNEEKLINILLPRHTTKLISLFDKKDIELSGSNRLKINIPAHTSRIYLLDTIN